MIEQALKNIGFTDGEIKIYLALLELGESSTGKITKQSGISGSKVYEVLDRLGKKGLVSHIMKNGVKYFEAAPPTRILEYLDERKNGIDQDKEDVLKVIPSLLLRQQHVPKSEVKVYTSWEGMKTVNQDIINTLKTDEEWLEMGLSTQPKSWEIYFNRKQTERAKKGIIHKSIINIKYKSLFKARKNLPRTQYRFFPENFEMPISTEIYKNKVAIFVLILEAPTTIVIESEHVAESFRKYFHVLWKTAKK